MIELNKISLYIDTKATDDDLMYVAVELLNQLDSISDQLDYKDQLTLYISVEEGSIKARLAYGLIGGVFTICEIAAKYGEIVQGFKEMHSHATYVASQLEKTINLPDLKNGTQRKYRVESSDISKIYKAIRQLELGEISAVEAAQRIIEIIETEEELSKEHKEKILRSTQNHQSANPTKQLDFGYPIPPKNPFKDEKPGERSRIRKKRLKIEITKKPGETDPKITRRYK